MARPLFPCAHIPRDGLIAWRISDMLFLTKTSCNWVEHRCGRLHVMKFDSWSHAVAHYAEHHGVFLYPPGAQPSPEDAAPYLEPGDYKHGHRPGDADELGDLDDLARDLQS